ncbi:9845_t:CDS:2 [Funneliformis caledonium]|uniref:9845_t:CDS:1 n=1 Tax=Funneliformis caledonium TaxID=1117310 RepID=A0A9N8V8C5_9GLOM|nr:9845_t:CDS:2 [Funneliformis caledonium]
MSSLEEQLVKKIRLNSVGSVPSNYVINNKASSEGKMTREGDVGILSLIQQFLDSGDIKQRYFKDPLKLGDWEGIIFNYIKVPRSGDLRIFKHWIENHDAKKAL